MCNIGNKKSDFTIYDWKDISHLYKNPDILLGNGFTMNLSNSFSYSSLFDKFVNTDQLNRNNFRNFNTTNFEFIIEHLLNAKNVLESLDFQATEVNVNKINSYIEILKKGLISTVKDIHPKSSNINKNIIESLAFQFRNFNNIYTLNYDLFMYQIIMKSNELHNKNKNFNLYQDYFFDAYSESFLGFSDTQNYKKYKNVFYLHGSLFLFNYNGVDLKLKRNNGISELIELVEKQINTNNFPLFVSEGTAQDKVKTINRSRYLRFALDNLKISHQPLVIFGTSLSKPDKHIIDAINNPYYNKCRSLAISIYEKDETIRDDICREFVRHFNIKNRTLHFFKAESIFDFNLTNKFEDLGFPFVA